MRRVTIGAVALLLFTAVLRSDDPKDKPDTPAQKYQALLKEYNDAYQVFIKAYREAKTDEERNKAQELYPKPDKFASKFLDFAKENASDPTAVDALIWVTTRDRESKAAQTAMETLKKDHLNDPKIGQVCQALIYQDSPEADQFLHTVLEKSKDKTAQGQACYGLAMHAKQHADEAIEKKQPDADKLTKEAETLFDRISTDFADVKYGNRTLGESAKGEIFELKNLRIGMVAPNIEAEDVDGTMMKLSEYKGKVVLIDFWGNW
jgi:hypothetical protein